MLDSVAAPPLRIGIIIVRVFLSTWVCVQPLLAVLAASTALEQWWIPNSTLVAPPGPYMTPVGEVRVQLIIAMSLACALLLVGITSAVVAGIPKFWRGRPAVAFCLVQYILSFSLVAVVAILPWEDPYDGQGSPLASLLSIIMCSILSVALFVPAAVIGGMLPLIVRQRQRSQPESPLKSI
jgi:hypothetical protein